MKTKDRILIIDDDRRFMTMVQSMLQEEGYEVASCSSAREGMEKLGQFDPDVLLLDWQMPDITGLDVISMIRKEQKYNDLYIIMLSGRIMTDNIVTAIKAGAEDYVIKPFSPEELMARIFNGVRSKRRRSIGTENKEQLVKGLQKIENISQQLSNAVGKDKRSAGFAADIKELASELKDLLKIHS